MRAAFITNRRLGAYAERAVVPVGLLARKPRSLSFEEAASLPTVALTIWQAFTERAHLKSGERVLIQAGAGGVGAFAIQLAKHMGAFVVATGGPNSQDFMAKLGADRTIDHAREKFEDAGPFDVVYDGVFHGPLTRPDGAQLAEIAQVVDSGAIRATVSKTYRLDQLASAYEVLAGGHARGKLAIVP
jgi:NADPH:quinone reductase-like Zn-dependent oxidoreductase